MVYINSVRGHHGGPIFFKKHLLHENAYVLIGRSETFLKVIHSSFFGFNLSDLALMSVCALWGITA